MNKQVPNRSKNGSEPFENHVFLENSFVNYSRNGVEKNNLLKTKIVPQSLIGSVEHQSNETTHSKQPKISKEFV